MPGRTFVSRMYKAVTRLKKLSHITRFIADFQSDLKWLYLFTIRWNSVSFLSNSIPDYFIATDASGSWAVFGSQWMYLAWSVDWAQRDVMAKELLPIVLNCVVWGPLLSGSDVEFKCDNRGCRLDKQGLLKGVIGYALFMMSLVFLSLLQYQHLSLPHPGCVQHFSWSAVKKQIGRVPRVESPCFHCPRNYPSVIIKTAITKKAGLDFPLLFVPFQVHHQQASSTPRHSELLNTYAHVYIVVDYVTSFYQYCFPLCFCCLWFVICLYGCDNLYLRCYVWLWPLTSPL